MAQLNVGEQNIYIHIHCMPWLNQMQENNTYIHAHITLHRPIEYMRIAHIHTSKTMASLNARHRHIYTCTHCMAWLKQMRWEQHIYAQYALHGTAQLNAAEQHICIHTHLAWNGLIK